MKRAATTAVIAAVRVHLRRLGRGSDTFCVGAFALSLVNLAAPPPAAPPLRPPALAVAPAVAAPSPAPPARAVVETLRPETPKAVPAPVAEPAPLPDPDDEIERLRRAADLLLKVNQALGAPQSPYGKIIYEVALRYSINPHLVAALIHVESAFNPRAVSRKGAYGLMQLLPETARRFGVHRKKDLFNPRKNLEAGIRYLAWLADRFGGDVEKILAAYNAGEGAVERFGGIPPYQETQSYVERIFGLLGAALPEPTPLAAAPPPAAPLPAEAVASR